MISIVDSVDFEDDSSEYQLNKLFDSIDFDSNPRSKVNELLDTIRNSQSISQSIDQSINQSISDDKALAEQILIKLIQKLVVKLQSFSAHSDDQSINESEIESYLRSINQCIALTDDLSINQSVNRSTSQSINLNLKAELIIVAVRYSLNTPKSIDRLCPDPLKHYIKPPTFNQSITSLALKIEQSMGKPNQSTNQSISRSKDRSDIYAYHLTTILTYLRSLMRHNQSTNQSIDQAIISANKSGYNWKDDREMPFIVTHIVGSLIDFNQSITLSQNAHHLLPIILTIIDDFNTANKIIGSINLSNLLVSVDQSVNQSINQSINPPINQSISQTNNQSISHSTNQSFVNHWPLLAHSAHVLLTYRDDEELLLVTIPLISDIICSFPRPINQSINRSINQSADSDGQYQLTSAYLDEFVYLSLSPSLEKRISCLLYTQHLLRISINQSVNICQHFSRLLPALFSLCDFITGDVRKAALNLLFSLIDCYPDYLHFHIGQLIDFAFSLQSISQHQLSIIQHADSQLFFNYSSKLGESRVEAEKGWKDTLGMTDRLIEVIAKKWPENAGLIQRIRSEMGE